MTIIKSYNADYSVLVPICLSMNIWIIPLRINSHQDTHKNKECRKTILHHMNNKWVSSLFGNGDPIHLVSTIIIKRIRARFPLFFV